MSSADSAGLDGEEMLAKLHALALESDEAEVLTRTYLSPAHKRAAKRLGGWMESAGMKVRTDGIGNVIGRFGEDGGRPKLLIGSHFDTVRNAGKYDGAYGIIAAVACVEALRDARLVLPFDVEVLGFADEEGVRFGATLLGSKAVAGCFDRALLQRCDAQNVSLAEAMVANGLEPDRLGESAYAARDVLAFVEVHIEQGPVLLDEDLAVGVVTAISGATRLSVDVTGRAGHAGTVPMHLRADALVAAAQAVQSIESLCSATPGLVGTVGEFEVDQPAVNVIPGSVRFSVDVRATEDQVREGVLTKLASTLATIGAERGVTFTTTQTHAAESVHCVPWLQDGLANAATQLSHPERRFASGAGHDAMAMASLCDVGMLFVRCGNGGISHHPDEILSAADAAAGAQVLYQFILNLAASSP